MRQIISIQIGQCGILLGSTCWQLFCLEHGISPDVIRPNDHYDHQVNPFFTLTANDSYQVRTICIDLEPSIIDSLKFGKYRELYKNQMLLTGKQQSTCCYARGYYSVGKQIVDIALQRVRKVVQTCQKLQGFVIFNSLGGGTGSGFGSLLKERLNEEYFKQTKLAVNIFPSSSLSQSSLEPYNSVLANHKIIQHETISIVLDNSALQNICKRKLNVESPNYCNFNRVVAQMFSGLTASIRFDGALNCDLTQFQTNLVPYPRVHFLTTAHSPYLSQQRSYLQDTSVYQVSSQIFDANSQLAEMDTNHGKFMAFCLSYRGDVVPKDVSAHCARMQTNRSINFVDWVPTYMKVGINYQPITVFPEGDIFSTTRTCTLVSNTTAVSEVFARINNKFDLMFAKRAFAHWYVMEGMEEEQFCQAREDLAALERDYIEVQSQTVDECQDQQP